MKQHYRTIAWDCKGPLARPLLTRPSPPRGSRVVSALLAWPTALRCLSLSLSLSLSLCPAPVYPQRRKDLSRFHALFTQFTESSPRVHREFVESSRRVHSHGVHQEFAKSSPGIRNKFTAVHTLGFTVFYESSPRVHRKFTKSHRVQTRFCAREIVKRPCDAGGGSMWCYRNPKRIDTGLPAHEPSELCASVSREWDLISRNE